MAHGADCYRDEAIYSILSLWRWHDPADFTLLVATDDPTHFERILGTHTSVRYLPLSATQLHDWRGSINYVHRIKSCVVQWAMQSGRGLALYGRGWDGLIPPDAVRTHYVPNEILASLYRAGGVVLCDHWDDMRRLGFISNRVFDAMAAEEK